MSSGTYQRFTATVRDVSGALVQHDFFVKSRAATDSAARAILPRLAEVLRVLMPTDGTQIAANVRHIKNSLTAYDTVARDGDLVSLGGRGCCGRLRAATCHFIGFDPKAVQS